MQSNSKPIASRLYGALIWPSQILAKLRDAFELPTGYQNETGFHFGAQPVEIRVVKEPGEAKRRRQIAIEERPERDARDNRGFKFIR
jgi:hypothetical protein